MDQLRQGIGLQAYGQRDPLVEYKMMGYDMFGEMTNSIAETTIRTLFHIRIEQKVEREQVAQATGTNKDDSASHTPKKREEKEVIKVVLLDELKVRLSAYEEPLKDLRDSL